MNKIIFIGTHGVGKTTLLEDVRSHINTLAKFNINNLKDKIVFITETPREWQKLNKVNWREMDSEDYMCFQRAVFSYYHWALGLNNNIISDRGLPDIVAYTMHFINKTYYKNALPLDDLVHCATFDEDLNRMIGSLYDSEKYDVINGNLYEKKKTGAEVVHLGDVIPRPKLEPPPSTRPKHNKTFYFYKGKLDDLKDDQIIIQDILEYLLYKYKIVHKVIYRSDYNDIKNEILQSVDKW
ncbi:MAG: AAA family ATPase [Candidatus Paceibacterota bacterium]|jgi:Cdc6-like AAA superfamily ATPase